MLQVKGVVFEMSQCKRPLGVWVAQVFQRLSGIAVHHMDHIAPAAALGVVPYGNPFTPSPMHSLPNAITGHSVAMARIVTSTMLSLMGMATEGFQSGLWGAYLNRDFITIIPSGSDSRNLKTFTWKMHKNPLRV